MWLRNLVGRALAGWVLAVLVPAAVSWAAAPATPPADGSRLLGMYVHQHWPYNHPYAARTWTLDDWRGYADGLKRLGYNAVLIWPMLETMPDPLTPSDRANIDKISRVIDVLHRDLHMRVYLCLCPNVGCDSQEAAKATFEKRHFFYCDTRVNPGDPAALKRLIDWREKLMRPLAAIDGVAIIDSDPGGYPASTYAEFVNLLVQHRRMLDQLRPGIDLWYWMHVGWLGYCRFYETAKFGFSTPAEQIDILTQLKAANPEPWGLANGLQYAEKLGIADRVISFNYGRIEGEPSFPMTNFGGDTAYTGAQATTVRGVMGNAQTHCLQLPNTFAFARGAMGKPLTEADYVAFANDLLVGMGAIIVEAWKSLPGKDVVVMRDLASRLEALPDDALKPGPLKGLLFGNPRRFTNDLVMQLRLRAAYEAFLTATQQNVDVKLAFGEFVTAVDAWQHQHGYENAWGWPGMDQALRKLNSPAINAVVGKQFTIEGGPDSKRPESPYEQLHLDLRRTETYVTRLIAAMKQAREEMK